MTNRSRTFTILSAVFIAAVIAVSAFAGPVAASTSEIEQTAHPDNIVIDQSSTSHDLAGTANLNIDASTAGTTDIAVKISLTPLTNAGADLSAASVSASATTGSVNSVNIVNNELRIGGTSDGSGDLDIGSISISGIDTTGMSVSSSENINYFIQVDDTNSGSFENGFSTDFSGNSNNFGTGFVEVVKNGNQQVVETDLVTALDNIPNNAGDFTVRAARTTYTLDEGDYTLANSPDSVTIEPANLGSGNLTIQDSSNDGGEMFGAGSQTKLTIKDAVIDASVDDQVFNLEAGGFDDLTLANTTVDDAGDGSSKDVITVASASNVDSVNLTDSKFIGGGNNQVLLDTLGGSVDADLTVVNNTFSGYDTVINAENDETFTNVDISDNSFKNNNVHIDDDNDNLGLNSVFQNSNNDFNKFAVSLNNNGNVGLSGNADTFAIYGDASQVTPAQAVDADGSTLELGPGTHSAPSPITIDNRNVNIKGADSVATDQVNLTVGNTIATIDASAGTPSGADSQGLTITGITFEDIQGNGPVINDVNTGNVINANISNNQFLRSTGKVISFSQSVTDAQINSNTFDEGAGTDPGYTVLDIGTTYSTEGSNTALVLRDNFVANTSDNSEALFKLGTATTSQRVNVINNTVNVDSSATNDVFDIDINDNSAEIRLLRNDIDGPDSNTAFALDDISENGDSVQVEANTITNTNTALDVTGGLSQATISTNTFNANDIQIAAGTISDYGAATLVSDNTFNQLAITTADNNGFQNALDNDNVKGNELYGSIEDAAGTVGAGGDTVFVAAGNYTETDFDINNNDQTLTSLSGADATTIQTATTNDLIQVSNDIDFAFEGFTVNSTDDGSTSRDIQVDSGNANVDVNNSVFVGPGTSNRIGIEVTSANQVVTRNNDFDTYDKALLVADSSTHTFNATTINNTGTAAVDIDADETEFNGLTITNSSVGVDDTTSNSDDITIRNGSIDVNNQALNGLGDDVLIKDSSVVVEESTTAIDIQGSGANVENVTVTTGEESVGINAAGSNAFINASDITADDVGVDVASTGTTIGNSTVTASGDALLANGLAILIDGGTQTDPAKIEDSVVENSTVGIRVTNNGDFAQIVRNQILNNSDVGVDVLDPGSDEVVVNFNDIVDNNVGIDVTNGNGDELDEAFANFYGDAGGPSGTVRAPAPANDVSLDGNGDQIRAGGGNNNIDEFLPFLTQSFTELPQDDEFVVVDDSRNIFRSSDSPTLPDDNQAEIVVAVLNDSLANQVETQNTQALSSLNQQSKTPDDSTSPTAANPIKFQFQDDEIGTFNITATQVSGSAVADSTSTQAIISGASDVSTTASSSTVISDGSTNTTITAQLTDGSGDAVQQSGESVSFGIRTNQSEAGASLTTTSATTNGSGQATTALTADTAGFDITVRAIAVNSQDSVTVSSVEEPQPSVSVNFTDQTVPNGAEEVTVDSANFTRADGSAGDYVVVVHTIDEFGAPVGDVSKPIGASDDLTGAEENINVNLTAADGPINNITENVTLRAMLHTTADDSAFGTRLGNAIDGIEPGDETDDANITVTEDAQPQNPVIVDSPAADLNGDGKLEDVNGDGESDFEDAIDLAFNIDAASENVDAFDFDEDGDVDFDDAIELAFE